MRCPTRMSVPVRACVRACVCERERERVMCSILSCANCNGQFWLKLYNDDDDYKSYFYLDKHK